MADSGGGELNEDEFLCCSICFHKYDLQLMRPKVLPCSHTFCFTCLKVKSAINMHLYITCYFQNCKTVNSLGSPFRKHVEVSRVSTRGRQNHRRFDLTEQQICSIHHSSQWKVTECSRPADKTVGYNTANSTFKNLIFTWTFILVIRSRYNVSTWVAVPSKFHQTQLPKICAFRLGTFG
jgi:hypothetical protein